MGIKTDFVFNGQGYGSVADKLIEANMDPGALRPWRAKNGKSYVTLVRNGKPKNFAINTPATLSWDAWKYMDRKLVRQARPRLRVWGDLVGAGLTFDHPDAMGSPILQEQTMTDFGFASVSMDGVRETDRDRPIFDIRNFPLPIVHGSYQFTARQLAAARRGVMNLDSGSSEQIIRKIVERIEGMCLGTAASYSYGGGTIYGLTNHPNRITKAMTLPTAGGWQPSVFIDEILDTIQDLQDDQFNGPYGLYYSPAWGQYLDGDYSDSYGGETLRTRLAKVEDITFRRKVHYGLSGFQVILFQLTEDVIRAINGLKMTTLQWDSNGGLVKNYKILAIMVPQLRTNADDEIGIAHGVAS